MKKKLNLLNSKIKFIKSYRLTYNQIFQINAHLGYLKKRWNPSVKIFLMAERNSIHILDFFSFFLYFKLIMIKLNSIIKNNGTITLFSANLDRAFTKRLILLSVHYCNIIGGWIPGMLTNFKCRIVRLLLSHSLNRHRLKKKLASIAIFNAFYFLLPSFIIGCIPNLSLSYEARKLLIPIIGISDSNNYIPQYDLIIPFNMQSFSALSFFIRLIRDASVIFKFKKS
jgi:small subunit ribosomal protein S2